MQMYLVSIPKCPFKVTLSLNYTIFYSPPIYLVLFNRPSFYLVGARQNKPPGYTPPAPSKEKFLFDLLYINSPILRGLAILTCMDESLWWWELGFMLMKFNILNNRSGGYSTVVMVCENLNIFSFPPGSWRKFSFVSVAHNHDHSHNHAPPLSTLVRQI